MVRPKREKTSHSHVFLFGSLFLFLLIFGTYKFSEAVILDPVNLTYHTNVLYYDGKFSDTNKVEDLKTALYVLNQSSEVVYATVYEYDRNGKEIKTAIQIMGGENQFIKPEGTAVVYLNNPKNTSSCIIKFSRWAPYKKFYPSNWF